MAKTISLSFKENPKELALYSFLKTKHSPSAFLKDLLEEHLSTLENTKENLKNKATSPETIPHPEPSTADIEHIASLFK